MKSRDVRVGMRFRGEPTSEVECLLSADMSAVSLIN
jgi:hypothetical protein